MKSYQQLGFTVNENDSKGNYMPRIQIGLVKEIYVSNPSFSCSQAIAEGEIAEKELKNSDREKFICIHLNIKNQIISYEVVSMGSLTCSLVRPATLLFTGRAIGNEPSAPKNENSSHLGQS